MTATLWLIVGFIGQGLFSARFIVQWLASERAKRSVVPIAFWFFSLGGGITLLAYALYRRDPVFILGQAAGLFIYARNLTLLRRESQCCAPASSGCPTAEASCIRINHRCICGPPRLPLRPPGRYAWGSCCHRCLPP